MTHQLPLLSNVSPHRLSRAVRETAMWRVNYGAGPSLLELLEALLGSQHAKAIAADLLNRFGDVRGLARATPDDLLTIKGIGLSTAARLKAALALAQRLLEPEAERPLIRSPEDAAALLTPWMSMLEQEHLVVLLLDTRGRLIGAPVTVYRGSLNTSLIRAGEVFRDAIKANAASILVAHNHRAS